MNIMYVKKMIFIFDIRIELHVSHGMKRGWLIVCANATVIIMMNNINLILSHRKNSYMYLHRDSHPYSHTTVFYIYIYGEHNWSGF